MQIFQHDPFAFHITRIRAFPTKAMGGGVQSTTQKLPVAIGLGKPNPEARKEESSGWVSYTGVPPDARTKNRLTQLV